MTAQPLPFTQLQKRLGRKRVDLWLTQEIPVQFVIFDVLYRDGELLLEMPLAQRRERLADLVSGQRAHSCAWRRRFAVRARNRSP